MGWTPDDALYGLPTDIRLRQTDLNLDQIPDYVAYRPSEGLFFINLSGLSDTNPNKYSLNPNVPRLTKDLAADLSRGSYINPVTGTSTILYWDDKTYPAGTTVGAKSIFAQDLAASGLAKVIAFGYPTANAIVDPENPNEKIYDRPTSRYTNTGAQLGVLRGNDYYYMDMYDAFQNPNPANLRYPGSPESGVIAKVSQFYHEKTKSEIAAEKAADLAASEASQLKIQANSQTFQDFQRQLGETFASTQRRLSEAFQTGLSADSATRSESFQTAQRALSEKFSTDQMAASQKYQSDQRALSEEFASDPNGTVRGQTFQEAQSALQKQYAEAQQTRSENFATEQMGLSQNFQTGLQQSGQDWQLANYGPKTPMTTTPTYNRYPSGRVGMKMGFAMPKGKNIFSMAPLNMKPSKGKMAIPKMSMNMSMGVPRMMHPHKGKQMATAFGFTHITPIAIVKMPKMPNPPHRPKSIAKMYRPKKGR